MGGEIRAPPRWYPAPLAVSKCHIVQRFHTTGAGTPGKREQGAIVQVGCCTYQGHLSAEVGCQRLRAPLQREMCIVC